MPLSKNPPALPPFRSRRTRPLAAAGVSATTEDKAAFMQLLFEMQIVQSRHLTQAEAFALLLAYARGDTAGFLDWVAKQAA